MSAYNEALVDRWLHMVETTSMSSLPRYSEEFLNGLNEIVLEHVAERQAKSRRKKLVAVARAQVTERRFVIMQIISLIAMIARPCVVPAVDETIALVPTYWREAANEALSDIRRIA